MNMTKLIGKLRLLACGLMLALTLGLGGCVTAPDGSSAPDYVLIEFGSTLAFTVIVNETDVSDATVVRAYTGLAALEQTLQTGGEALDLTMLDAMFANAVPIEYSALASQGSKLIRSRVRQYMDIKLPSNPITESEVTVSTALAVVQGAKAALYPKYVQTLK
jgi:hypothetical protein